MLEASVNQPQDLYARPLYGSDLHFRPLDHKVIFFDHISQQTELCTLGTLDCRE